MKQGKPAASRHLHGLYVADSREDVPGVGDITGSLRRLETSDPVFQRILNDIIENADDAPWRSSRDGVKIRSIWDDRSFLIHCSAGVHFPPHVHDREELLVVLDGEMIMGGQPISTGHFEVSPIGTEHPAGEVVEECLLLVQYSK